jgi:hypothetical protein
MRQSIRVLGWTITIASLLTFAFLGFSIYSLFQLVMDQGITPGESSVDISNGDYVISLPFIVNNTSHFDITKLDITTVIKDPKGDVISQSTTSSGTIPSGSSTNISHYISIDLSKMIEKNLTDGIIFMDTTLGLRYANIIEFSVTMANVSIPWDASISPKGTFSVSSNGDGAPFGLGNKTNVRSELLLCDQFRIVEVDSCPF